MLGLDEELDGSRVAIAGRVGDAHGGVADRALVGVVEHGGRGLLDHLLVASLHRAVAHADRPGTAVGRAVPVGDDLHLDVPGSGDVLLEEDPRIAECLPGLGLRGGQRTGEGLRIADQPDAAAATAGGGLEHHRVAEACGMGCRFGRGVDDVAAPRHDRDADLLGETLGRDLVAEHPDRGAVRADEDDAGVLASLGEGGAFRDEPPADPDGVDVCGEQGRDDALLVEVGRLAVAVGRVDERGRAETDRLVREAEEPGLRVRVGVDDDRGDGLAAAVPVEFTDRVEGSHCRLAPVENGKSSNLRHG